MHDWLSFQGRVVPMEWGRSTYTVLPLPDEIALELEKQNARRVDIELNDHPFNMALTTGPAISGTFVYAGKSILQEVGISPGQEIEVRLRKADPGIVNVPSDVSLAIRAAELVDVWTSLTPGRQRGLLHQITSAKKQETRARRIAQLLQDLAR
ncbi:YdeI/OmpD-associated family protein [Hoeflea sp.]|uniref:YdeI/OmpD-associated family protein n=1 Tax=Hoeflea sp. TaxID=1940281 RepID=UPI003B01CD07